MFSSSTSPSPSPSPSPSSSSPPSSARLPSQDHTCDSTPPPSPLCSPSTRSAALPEHAHHPSPTPPGTVLESPPLDSRPFHPHVLGIGLGIASPRPIHGPLSPFHRYLGDSRSSPVLTHHYPPDVPLQNIHPASHATNNPASASSSTSTATVVGTIPTVSSSLPPYVESPPLALPPPTSGTSHHPFEYPKAGSAERAPADTASPLPSPSLKDATSPDVFLPSPAQAQGSPRAGSPISMLQSVVRPSSSPRPSSPSPFTTRTPPGGMSPTYAALKLAMPVSAGNTATPSVRSPLGHEVLEDAAPLLPSPEIIKGHVSSQTDNTNPFSFQPPSLDNDELCATDSGASVSDEHRNAHSLRNPFYHPSDFAGETSHHHASIQTDPADIPSASFTPISATHNPNTLYASDAPGSDDFTEFDTEGYSTLEKIYLFSRSRVSFHRVFIAKSLGMFLSGDGGSVGSIVSSESSPGSEEQYSASADTISPDDAVQYVLPLLNGLAMDEDEAVKEALASELVPIIWWFLTRCKVVDVENPLEQYTPDDDEEEPSFPHVLAESSTTLQDVAIGGQPAPLPPTETLRAVSEPIPSTGHTWPEHSHGQASSSDPGTRHANHHNSLTALVHVHPSPSSSPHASIVSLPPLPPLQSHTPDHPSPLGHIVFTNIAEADEVTAGEALISVQSFTPILGTLLLSPNSHVGGPVRYAVVELLRRIRKADDYEHHTATQLPADPAIHPLDEEEEDERYSDIGLFGEEARRLFEREMIHQVVIGMGRLDSDPPDEQVESEQTSGSGLTTAAGTPFASGSASYATHRSSPGLGDSYFPPVSPPSSEYLSDSHLGSHRVSPLAVYPSPSSSPLTIDMPPSTSSFADFVASGLLSPPLEMAPSPSMSASASPFGITISPSPFMSPSPVPSTASFMSTPSLVPGASPSVISLPSDSSRPSTTSSPSPSDSSISGNVVANNSTSAGTWIPPRSPGDLPCGLEDDRQRFGRETDGGGVSHVANWASADNGTEETDPSEEAAVGRLSSMSLMAAVTATVVVSEEHQAAFVAEVQRVGRDTVYWVRREASFVVGALAKVVPAEVVMSSLLPLFEALCHDTTWQVRHSALFALPAILSRLSPEEKRKLALEVMLPLSKDESSIVRSGVLEALAEVMYTFHEDPAGPPEELTRLFLGIREGETQRRQKAEPVRSPSSMSWSEFMVMATSGIQSEDDYDIYEDLTRPLVCAFNFPAVTLTLGRDRWSELRELYLELSLNELLKVRKTLAASLGEMAKIVGPEHTKRDLMGVWWGSVRADEGDVRLKAIECLAVFIGALAEQERQGVVDCLVGEVWNAKLKGWREREGVIRAVGEVVKESDMREVTLRKLVMQGLRDPVAAVREATVEMVTMLVEVWTIGSTAVRNLLSDINGLAVSSSYRERMTYIACQQDIFLAGLHGAIIVLEEFWHTLLSLVQDAIVDVRIKVARFLGFIFDRVVGAFEPLMPQLLDLVRTLSLDVSVEVKAFCQPILDGLHSSSVSNSKKTATKAENDAFKFSRPPLSVFSPG